MGEHRLSTDPDCKDGLCNETPQDFEIEENIFHEDYGKPVVFRNDIAILRLSRPVIKTGNFLFKEHFAKWAVFTFHKKSWSDHSSLHILQSEPQY